MRTEWRARRDSNS